MRVSYLLNTVLELILPQTTRAKEAESISYEQLVRVYNPQIVKDEVVALFPYRDKTVRTLLLELKYYKNKHAAKLFGEALVDYLLEELAQEKLFGKTPIIIPIPRSYKEEQKRGFNQVVVIEEFLAKKIPELHIKTDILVRAKKTESQTKLKDKAAREKNVKDAFVIRNAEVLKGHSVILLDDVVTTGATMSEAKCVLLESGAQNILCIALAH